MKKLKEYKNSKKNQNNMNRTHDVNDVLTSNLEGPHQPSKAISNGIYYCFPHYFNVVGYILLLFGEQQMFFSRFIL